MKLKKVLTAFGIVTVAVTGTGALPAFADEQSPAATDVLPFVLQDDSSFYGVQAVESGRGHVQYSKHATEAEAAAAASAYSFPSVGEVGQVRLGDTDLCLTARPAGGPAGPTDLCSRNTASTQFNWEYLDNVNGAGWVLKQGDLYVGVTGTDSSPFLNFSRDADEAALVSIDLLRAVVSDIDIAGRSAVLSGIGTPGAQIIINDADQVTVGADGTWSWFLEGLKLGSNPVHIEQWERQNGGAPTKTAETDVDAKLAFVGLSASVEFDAADISKPAILSGQAEPGATVAVADAAGTVIATETAHSVTGRWSASLTAPNQAGIVPFTVSQTITGELAETLMTSADYGTGVEITSPANGDAHDGGAVTFRGEGLPGSTVELFDGDKRISSVTVLVNGQWNKSLTLDGKEHVITAKQASKGGNVTSSVVTLNPGAELGFEIVTPGDGTSVEAQPIASNPTSGLVTFTGTGAADSQVVVQTSAGGRVVGTAKTDAQGNWSLTGGLGFVKYNLAVTYTPQGGAAQVSTHELTVTRPVVEAPFEVTTPAHESSVEVAPMASNPTSGLVTFTGRGTSYSTVQIKTATDGRIVGTTTVDADGNWSLTGGLGFVKYDLEVAYAAKGAETVYSTHTLTVTSTATERPFELESPLSDTSVQGQTNPSDANQGLVTFTGTATTGTVVELINVANGRVVGKATATNMGEWTFTGGFAYQTYPVGSLSLQYTMPGQATVSSEYGLTITR